MANASWREWNQSILSVLSQAFNFFSSRRHTPKLGGPSVCLSVLVPPVGIHGNLLFSEVEKKRQRRRIVHRRHRDRRKVVHRARHREKVWKKIPMEESQVIMCVWE